MKSLTVVLSLCLMIGLCGLASAQGITDPSGDAIGPIDLTAARAEFYERPGPNGDATLLKLSIASTPTIPGAVIFQADVDGSADTGGGIGLLGAPVPPCAGGGCKEVAGMDIALTVYNRQQADTSGSAFCASCSDDTGSCGRAREAGEWYALTSLSGQPQRALGVLRGFTDPASTGVDGKTEMTYTFPYNLIIAYASGNITPGDPDKFNFAKAQDPVTNCKWDISIFHDAAFTDGDDITSLDGGLHFDVSDWAPNGDQTKADAEAADLITYCEGNLDGDQDVDGTDASKFKENFGRNQYNDPCSEANAWW